MGDRERHIAIREAEQIHSSTEYFDARPHLTSMESRRVFDAGFVRGFDAATERLRAAQPAVPSLSVVYGPMPETNGKSNFTAILCRDGDVVDGFTIARSEYPDRVRYDADCVRFIIGELSERPNLLDYDGEAMTLVDDLTRNLDALPTKSTEEFSTEGVNRIADSFEKAGRPVLAQCLRDLAKQRDELAARLDSMPATPPADAALADDIRAAGLTVAVHNDYRLNGVFHTFWLFVGPDGMSYKGEGRTDTEALNQIRAALRARTAVPEGFVLVPVEPTPRMIDATWDHEIDRDGGIESQNKRNRRIYAAMLAASQRKEE